MALGYPGFVTKLLLTIWARMPELLVELVHSCLRFLVRAITLSTEVLVERRFVATSRELIGLAGTPMPGKALFRAA